MLLGPIPPGERLGECCEQGQRGQQVPTLRHLHTGLPTCSCSLVDSISHFRIGPGNWEKKTKKSVETHKIYIFKVLK
jgi:hypothetical protein